MKRQVELTERLKRDRAARGERWQSSVQLKRLLAELKSMALTQSETERELSDTSAALRRKNDPGGRKVRIVVGRSHRATEDAKREVTRLSNDVHSNVSSWRPCPTYRLPKTRTRASRAYFRVGVHIRTPEDGAQGTAGAAGAAAKS